MDNLSKVLMRKSDNRHLSDLTLTVLLCLYTAVKPARTRITAVYIYERPTQMIARKIKQGYLLNLK